MVSRYVVLASFTITPFHKPDTQLTMLTDQIRHQSRWEGCINSGYTYRDRCLPIPDPDGEALERRTNTLHL